MDHIDETLTFLFLEKGYLYPVTEGFIVSVQGKITRTRNIYVEEVLTHTEPYCKCSLSAVLETTKALLY